ncbi:helix-turn-helix domain-containing protein [Streptomyces sp. NPDC029554]|uniref:PucR family transcriptional regulator n=1 Tax=Streptomyces sp. NPDC029554 TaxID=3155126 RepID=UPI0033F2B6D0
MPLAAACLGGEPLSAENLDELRRFAVKAADQGTALHVLVGEYVSSARHVWTQLASPGQGSAPVDLKAVGAALINAIGEATTALTEGYETAHRAAIRGEEAMRREFVDDLLDGRTGLGRLAERAERFGLRLVGPHCVAVASAPEPFGAGDNTTRYIEEALSARFGAQDVLITTKDGLLVCVSPGTAPDVADFFAAAVSAAAEQPCRIATSRFRPGPNGIVRCYQEARSTLELAVHLGLTKQRLHAADLLVYQVLGRDRAAITDLVATVLGGLEQARGGPGTLLDTLAAFFASGGMNTTTARRLRVSVRTVTYRLTRVRELTGHDPTDPDQRYVLQTAVLGARLLDWPTRPLQPSE